MSDRMTEWQVEFDRRASGEADVDEESIERLAAGVRDGWAVLTQDRLMTVATLLGERKRLSADVERLRAERDALAEDIRERIESSTAMMVDLGQATAEAMRLRGDIESERLALESLTNELALAVGHTGAPADLLAELVERAKAAEPLAESPADGWTYSPTEDRYEGPDERSAYVFDGELTIEGPGLPGHSAVDLSVPVTVARSLLIRPETRPAR